MRRGCDLDALEELAHGRLSAEDAAQVTAHASGCAACTNELAWLRAERALALRQAKEEPPLSPEIWKAVERRISPAAAASPGPATDRLWALSEWFSRSAHLWSWRRAGLAAAVAMGAAAALVVVLRPPHQSPAGPVAVARRPAADPSRVLDGAEREYRQAIATLESELAGARPQGSRLVARWRSDLALARNEVADARGAAGNDPDARLRVLDGYAAYLQSLQTVVLAVERRSP
jgi:Putative zinc-finger